ncbi:MAG: glycosyltransferase family 4 protein, partial [Nitrososphaerota archaeon]|nr:glycosyltransferase family 4 protein [Nitrososphaerota archaeon]
MKKMGARDDRLFLFPGGIDDEDIISLGSEGALRAKYNLPANAKLISSLGTVEERKNPLGVIEVAKLLSKRGDIHFVIAGRVEGDYGDRVKKEAEALPNVTVLGSISEQEKAALIRTSTANITLSRSEALGISQLEFMSAGIPVITSGVGGQSWIVKDGSNGLVVDGPDDVKGAAEAVRKMADRPHLRRRLGRAAEQTGSAYSLTRLVDRLSRRLQDEIRARSDDMPAVTSMSGDERVIEAWSHNGQRVAATTRRLIVRSIPSGREMISVPYDDISTIRPHAEAPWTALGVGAIATVALLAQRVAGFQVLHPLVPVLSSLLSPLAASGAAATVVTLLPFVPLAASAAA